VTSLVDPTMYRPKKKMTKAERLMTALYVTHYCKIKHTLMPMLGGQADDIISLLGETLLRYGDRWDGNDEKIFNFLIRSAKRLAINRLRDRKRERHECDLIADTATEDWQVTDLRAFGDYSESADAIVIDAIEREELREMLRIASQDSPEDTKKLRAEVFEEMLGESFSATEYARAHNLNKNTIHSYARRIRSMCYDQKRLGGACPERVNPYS
jgi:DNA-directed RNA polymerase specialized sigma24 family protein